MYPPSGSTFVVTIIVAAKVFVIEPSAGKSETTVWNGRANRALKFPSRFPPPVVVRASEQVAVV